jgi:arylsulfatase A-like enzyme
MNFPLNTLVLLWALCSLAQSQAQQMNVVFILVDDWGWTDAGVQGSDYFETPKIDRCASQSLRFTQAYSASPVCSPTRAAIMTGKSPARLDMTIWHEGARDGGPKERKLLNAHANPDLPRAEFTLAEFFKQKHYDTAHIGKWHLGRSAFYPETQGYDINIGGTYWGAPSTFHFPYRGTWSKWDPEYRYVPVGMGKPGDYLTDKLTDHAIDFIEQHKNSAFFLSLWFHTVHTPIEAKAEDIARFEAKQPGSRHQHPVYAAMVASLDANIGRVLEKLHALKLSSNTVVVLTSDNGGVDFPSGKSGNQAPTSNAPLRSGKGTLYEGGIRVPLMIRWPGRTAPGSICENPVTSEDFFPTLAAGLAPDTENLPGFDGVNILPLLDDPKTSPSRDTLYWHYPHYYERMTPASAIRDGEWKLIHYYEDNRVELYNLTQDPSELHDLAIRHPIKASSLRTKLDAWRNETGANAPRPNPRHR